MSKLVYQVPLDIFALFRDEERVADVCRYLVDYVVKDAQDLRRRGKLVMPVVAVGRIGYNIDINYFLFVLGEYIGSEKLFEDWKSTNIQTVEKAKRLTLFFNGFLNRTLGMVYINKQIRPEDKINGSIAIMNQNNYFNQVVYRSGDEVVQFNAVALVEGFLFDNAGSSMSWDSFVKIANGDVEQLAFGKKECDKVWTDVVRNGFKKSYFMDI